MELICGSATLTDINPETPGLRAREYSRELSGICEVLKVGKFRNGTPKAWCKTHAQFVRQSEATHCRDAGSVIKLRCLSLDIDQYAGGIGVWGSLPPAIDTASTEMDSESLLRGVHVHARREPRVKKEVDETYDLVALFRGSELLVLLDTASATALVQSHIANLPTRLIQCSHCGAEHIDEGWFAVVPHRKHQCMCCGREFWQPNSDAGNAIDGKLREVFSGSAPARVSANRTIDLGRHLAAGRHIRIWGTHQALVWTAERPEESGVHVHVYNDQGEYVVDETFDQAIWRGVILDADEVRLLMLQRSLAHLDGRLASVPCSSCGSRIFSQGSAAVVAGKEHCCNSCHQVTTTGRKLVSNPLASFEAS
jgi:hypothetical protein